MKKELKSNLWLRLEESFGMGLFYVNDKEHGTRETLFYLIVKQIKHLKDELIKDNGNSSTEDLLEMITYSMPLVVSFDSLHLSLLMDSREDNVSRKEIYEELKTANYLSLLCSDIPYDVTEVVLNIKNIIGVINYLDRADFFDWSDKDNYNYESFMSAVIDSTYAPFTSVGASHMERVSKTLIMQSLAKRLLKGTNYIECNLEQSILRALPLYTNDVDAVERAKLYIRQLAYSNSNTLVVPVSNIREDLSRQGSLSNEGVSNVLKHLQDYVDETPILDMIKLAPDDDAVSLNINELEKRFIHFYKLLQKSPASVLTGLTAYGDIYNQPDTVEKELRFEYLVNKTYETLDRLSQSLTDEDNKTDISDGLVMYLSTRTEEEKDVISDLLERLDILALDVENSKVV